MNLCKMKYLGQQLHKNANNIILLYSSPRDKGSPYQQAHNKLTQHTII